jgi:hypothetical protein
MHEEYDSLRKIVMSRGDKITEWFEKRKYATFNVPDCELFKSLETGLGDLRRQRLWMISNEIFIRNRHFTKREREFRNCSLSACEKPIYSDTWRDLAGKNFESEIKNALTDAEAITLTQKSHFDEDNPKNNRPNVYALSEELLTCGMKKVVLTGENYIRNRERFYLLRAKPFEAIDRHIITKNHSGLKFSITGADFCKKHKQECLEEAAIRKPKILIAGSEVLKVWEKSFDYMCRGIDYFNALPDEDKWHLCKVDRFGKRLHHQLTCVFKVLRKYATLRGHGERLVPLFEVDMVAAQPFIAALNMAEAGLKDDVLVADLAGDFYTEYANRRGEYWSRAKAKEMTYRALYDDQDSLELGQLKKCYPDLFRYLFEVKTTLRPEEEGLKHYLPYKNNCRDAQRGESSWARLVWTDLQRKGYRFLPIHDSVLIFGSAGKVESGIQQMINDVEAIMKNNIDVRWPMADEFGLRPKFKTIRY